MFSPYEDKKIFIYENILEKYKIWKCYIEIEVLTINSSNCFDVPINKSSWVSSRIWKIASELISISRNLDPPRLSKVLNNPGAVCEFKEIFLEHIAAELKKRIEYNEII